VWGSYKSVTRGQVTPNLIGEVGQSRIEKALEKEHERMEKELEDTYITSAEDPDRLVIFFGKKPKAVSSELSTELR
jgi:hypothetical protein